jgi:molybdopterin/thiamine biosynthesis adenylyltransferase
MGEEYLKGMLERTLLFYPTEKVERVRDAIVAIAGFGGVGAITAELLARWGVKKFRLLDKDRYEPSNLNRQLFATSKTLGRLKAEVAAERIKEICPDTEIEMIIADKVDNENVLRFVSGAGIVIQTADSPSCQLFYRAAKRCRVPIVNGYSTLIGVRVQAYDYRNPNFWYRVEEWRDRIKWRGQKDLTEMSRAELEAFDKRVMHPAMPTMNFVTNIAGAMIVGEAIKLLTGTGRPVCFPYVTDFDLFRNRMKVIHLYSPLRMETLAKVFGRKDGRADFQSVISKAKARAGVA